MSDEMEEELQEVVTVNWEATFRPYRALIQRLGFDGIIDAISALTFDENDEFTKRWGEASPGSNYDRQITLAVEAVEGHLSIEDFQDDVGELIKRANLEGDIFVSRIVTVGKY